MNVLHKQLKKIICVVLMLILVCLCACQPNPEVPPMVNRSGGLPEGSVIDPLPEGEYKEIDAPKHWKETLFLDDEKIKLEIDADINFPQISNTPILEMRQVPFTEQKIEELIKYFVGDAPLYKPQPMTKGDLEILYSDMKNREGEFNSPYSRAIEKNKLRVEELIELAADKEEKIPVEIALDYPRQDEYQYILWPDDDEMKTKNTFEAWAEIESGINATIKATTYDTDVGSTSCFSIENGIIYTHREFVDDRFWSEDIFEWQGTTMENLVKINDDWVDEEKKWIAACEERIQENTIDYEWAEKLAEQILTDLSIDSFVLEKAEKGLQFLSNEQVLFDFNARSFDLENTECGYEFIYYRENAGLVATAITDGFYRVEVGGDAFPNSPPFFAERISIFITEEGVQGFVWKNAAAPYKVIAENTKLIPFEEVVERYKKNILHNAYGYSYRIELHNVELRLAYAPAYDAPKDAWLTPVWIFTQDWYYDENGKELSFGKDVCQFSAIDGGYIAPADGQLWGTLSEHG